MEKKWKSNEYISPSKKKKRSHFIHLYIPHDLRRQRVYEGKKNKDQEGKFEYCTFLNLKCKYEGKSLPHKVARKVDAMKQYFHQYYRDLFSYLKNREARLKEMKELEALEEWDEEEKKEMWREHFEKESNFLREKRARISLNDLTVLAKLGKGGYGEVYLCRKNDTGELMAVKKLNKTRFVHKNEVHRARKEREILTTVDSNRLVQLYYCFQTRDDLFMCMEYVPGGDLKHLLDNLGCLSEEDAKFYFAEMLLAVDDLHSLGYIHRDLKPDNFMIDKRGHLKLIDFGLSKEGWDSKYFSHFKTPPLRKARSIEKSNTCLIGRKKKEESVVGSPEYIAVEVLENQTYTALADYWSLGVILYEMIASYTPFIENAYTADDVFNKVLNWRKVLKRPIHCEMSDQCWDLITKIICDPSIRLGWKGGIADIKEHPWFDDFDWDNIDNMKPPFVPKLENDADTSYFKVNEVGNGNDNVESNAEDFNSLSSELDFSDASDRSSDVLSQGTHYSDEKQFEWSGFTWRRSSYDPSSHLKSISPRRNKRMSESDICIKSLRIQM